MREQPVLCEPRFHRLYQANFRSIQAYAVNRVGSADDAADIVAEIFTAAWRRLETIPPPPADRLWLYRTARQIVCITGLAIARAAAIVDWSRPAVHGPVTKLPHQARSGGPNRKRALLASAAVILVAAGGYGVSKALDTPGRHLAVGGLGGADLDKLQRPQGHWRDAEFGQRHIPRDKDGGRQVGDGDHVA